MVGAIVMVRRGHGLNTLALDLYPVSALSHTPF